MITALDTNILLDILLSNEDFADASIRLIELSAQAGSLVICDLVYAELCGHFEHKAACDFTDKTIAPLMRNVEKALVELAV